MQARKKAARHKREEADAKLMDSVGAVFTGGRGKGTAYKGGRAIDVLLGRARMLERHFVQVK